VLISTAKGWGSRRVPARELHDPAALSVRLSFPFARPSSASASFPFPSLPPPSKRYIAFLCLRAVPSFPVPFRPLWDGAFWYHVPFRPFWYGAFRYICTFAPNLHGAIRYICTFDPQVSWGVLVQWILERKKYFFRPF
jgi:hypothetical protein